MVGRLIGNMLFKVRKSDMHGTVSIPGSKSHTIKYLFIASLAEGRSVAIPSPFSRDAFSAADVCRAFGARFEKTEESFVIDGFVGRPSIPENIVDVGNSGTSLRFALMSGGLPTAGLSLPRSPDTQWVAFSLIRAMNALGGNVFSIRGNDMAGWQQRRLKGGSTELDSFTSQYLSSILINAPLLERDTEVTITRLTKDRMSR